MGDQTSVGLHAQQVWATPGRNQEAVIWQEIDGRHSGGDVHNKLAVAVKIDGPDLASAHVDTPQPPIMPARRLAEDKTVHQRALIKHSKAPCRLDRDKSASPAEAD